MSVHRTAPGVAPGWVSAAAARARRSEAVAAHARLPAKVLALVEMNGHDRQIVEAARTLAGSDHPTIVLLHVARPVFRNGRAGAGAWERMAAVDEQAQRALRRLAARLLPPSIPVHTAVRFGEPVEQTARAAMAVDATVVVALSRPARWLWWRNRDRRFRRILPATVMLVPREEAADSVPRCSIASGGRSRGVRRPRSSTPGESRLSA